MHFSAFRLQQAIRNREFTPFYQPIVCATGGEVVGCEMLARWLHPQKGLLSAGNFIPAIEATGLGGALLRGLADEVCGDGQDLARTASATQLKAAVSSWLRRARGWRQATTESLSLRERQALCATLAGLSARTAPGSASAPKPFTAIAAAR